MYIYIYIYTMLYIYIYTILYIYIYTILYIYSTIYIYTRYCINNIYLYTQSIFGSVCSPLVWPSKGSLVFFWAWFEAWLIGKFSECTPIQCRGLDMSKASKLKVRMGQVTYSHITWGIAIHQLWLRDLGYPLVLIARGSMAAGSSGLLGERPAEERALFGSRPWSRRSEFQWTPIPPFWAVGNGENSRSSD